MERPIAVQFAFVARCEPRHDPNDSIDGFISGFHYVGNDAVIMNFVVPITGKKT